MGLLVRSPAFRYVIVAALVLFLLFRRAPDAFRVPQFWAEDGAVFWLQQYHFGFWHSLWVSSAGYLHALPRLVAGLASPLPYEMHPTFFVIAAAALTAWTAVTIAATTYPPLMAVLMGMSIVMVPHPPPGEVWATPTNIQWITAVALPIIAADRTPQGVLSRANQIIFVTLAGLSGPFALIAAPLWIWRALKSFHVDRFGVQIAVLGLATGAVQAGSIILSRTNASTGAALFDPTSLSVFILRWLSDPFFFRSGVIAAVVAALILLSMSRGAFRSERTAYIVFAVLLLCAAALKMRADDAALPSDGYGYRYFFVPVCMLLCCAITIAFEKSSHLRILGAVAAATIVFGSSKPAFKRPATANLRAEWIASAPLIGHTDVTIQIPPNWVVRIAPRTPR